MDSLKDLIRSDEEYKTITPGKCSVCGEPYALITGSDKTFYKDGRRYAQINSAEKGWASFRCHGCKQVLEKTWVETTSPTI